MAIQQLSLADQEIIRRCLVAICDGPFLEDAEFHPRIGVAKESLKNITHTWPAVDDSDDESDAALAINNALNELCYGLPISPEDWTLWIIVPRTEIIRVYQEWARIRGWKSTGVK